MIVVLAVIAALALALAPTAAAKEISKVEVCGEGECAVLIPGKDLSRQGIEELAEVVAPANPPAAASAWFQVRFTIDHGSESSGWTNAWVPGAQLLRAPDESGSGYRWFTVSHFVAMTFGKVTNGIDPLPASTLKLGHVVAPPEPAAPASGGSPWGWIVLAVAAAGAAVVALRGGIPRLRRLARG